MKTFKDYFFESKKLYEFKIKLAGAVCENARERINSALAKYNVNQLSEGKRLPIQECYLDFPNHKNIEVTIFDVIVEYPVTSVEIKNVIKETLCMLDSCIQVRNFYEEKEIELNTAHLNTQCEPVLGQPYPKENHQHLVGDKRNLQLIKELSKNKKGQGVTYDGIKSPLLVKKVAKEK